MAVALAAGTLVVAADRPMPPIDGLPFQVGAFDARPVAAGHPRVFFSADEIERAKQLIEENAAYKQVFDKLIAEADKQLDLEIKPLDESWWEADKSKPWEETYPQVFLHTMREPTVYATPAGTLATAWLLTGREVYADKAEALLLNLADYQFVAEHYDVGMNYTIWVLQALKAYDALLPEIRTAHREKIDAMFTRAAWAVANNDIYWIKNNIGGGLNNHLAWHKMMLGLFGLFYDRPEMVQFCLHGRRGLVSLLEEGLMDDGLWCESSLVYHFTAIVPMAIFADCQRRMNGMPALCDLVLANGRTLEQPFDAMFNVLAPDGLVPPVGDAYGLRTKLWDNSIYEFAWAAWGDPKYAWLLSKAKERSPHSLFSPPLPAGLSTRPAMRSVAEEGERHDRAPEPATGTDHERAPRAAKAASQPPHSKAVQAGHPHHNNARLSQDARQFEGAPDIRTALFPEHGYVFLRSHTGPAYWDNPEARCAFLTYDRSGVHSNADKLSLMLFGQNRMLLSDVEGKATVPHAFSSKIQRELNRGALSQNTVMIDGLDQRGTARPLRLAEYRDLPDEKRATAADEEGLLYEGVRQMRTVCLTADYVLDVFQVNCGQKDRQIDWIAHIMDDKTVAPEHQNPSLPKLKPFDLPQTGAWPWIRGAKSYAPDGPIAFDWRNEGARLRLRMPNPAAERVILCGYPATDEPAAGMIPMLIVRYQGKQAVFAALWLIGDRPREATLIPLPPRPGYLAYEVRASDRSQQHLVPLLAQ